MDGIGDGLFLGGMVETAEFFGMFCVFQFKGIFKSTDVALVLSSQRSLQRRGVQDKGFIPSFRD